MKPNTWEWEPDRLAGKIVVFCRFARSNGLSAGMQRTIAALEASRLMGISDLQTLGFALRAVLCSSPEEWQAFDRLYREFWLPPDASDTMPQKPANVSAVPGLSDSPVLVGLDHGNAGSPQSEGKMVCGASSQQRLKTVDFSEVPLTDLADFERLALRLSRRMSIRLSRRLKIKELGDRVDLRRSIRRSISRGGDPISLAFKHRKVQKRRLVIFLDISGSMNLYSLYLVRFAYALHKHFRRVHTFLFSTRVVDVSEVLRARSLTEALRKLSQRATEWSSGTRIGASLHEFNRAHGRKLLARNTVFVILSDGWDTGAPEVLTAELQTTRTRVEKLIWLNPLLGLGEYQPVTRGMSAALPYVDVFAPAHNLQSLLALETYLH